ncbi:hypothetical protein U2F26_30905 [Micromonospora sp. 4G57]|uniref:DUF4393 domain-containing protein n=1 Tax=Micromonospora sicca TaxID=2202420 RepID=A0ABU5JK82_9ACTN|nr:MULTISPECIES: hypothetical protein [unclassified Micromonospora]MDZ5447078.1 hypothetical protein [Micromonospora sp. 4G57]MDZ5493045.1 hypothetical protein [Micromonospora sp. 4G53]
MEPTYPVDSDRRQGLTRVAEMTVASIPGVGSALQIAMSEGLARRLSERREKWLNQLAEKVFRLEDQIGDFAHLAANDTFVDAVTTAAQIADRTSRKEKLELLRNAAINAVMPSAPDEDLQQLFFDLIARFTPTHVRLLKLLSDPPGWFDRVGIARPSYYSAARSAIIEVGMPELNGRKDLIDRYGSGLSTTGLVNGSLNGMMTENGLWTPATTELGRQFLSFIEDPETP